MKILQEKAEQVFDIVLKTSEADETEIHFDWTQNYLTRFANNEIHQNLGYEDIEISIRSVFGKKTARTSTHKLDTPSLQRATRESNRLALLSRVDPFLLPMPKPQNYSGTRHAFERTAHMNAESRARAVKSPIQIAKSKGLVAAGIFSNRLSRCALANSSGLRAFYEDTYAVFSTTMMKDSGSSWAKYGHPNASEIPVEMLSLQAAEKAALSRDPIEISPDQYTVILEPSAVLDLMEFLLLDFGALSVLEKTSSFTDRIGEKLFGSNIHMDDDVSHPLQSGPPFDGEGIARQKINLVHNGILKNLVYSQSTGGRSGKSPTGHGFRLPNTLGEAPTNLVLHGGSSSLEEMIRTTDQGLLITRFWYIREVDPMQKILTGMTRDGTFLIKDGRIHNAVRNLRFNESLFHLLNHVIDLGPSVRASGEEGMDMVVPALKAVNFHFTSTTKY